MFHGMITYILFHQMSILRLFEPFPKEISDMSENNENKVRNISCNQIKIRRFIHDRDRHWLPLGMPTHMSMTLISDSSELSILLSFLLPFVGMIGCGRWTGMVEFRTRR